MATYDSAYYYKQYKRKKALVNDCDDNIKALQKIRDALTDTMYDEIRDINNELDALMVDLKKSVRYNSAFTRRANEFGLKKQKGVTADAELSACIRELEEEICRLTTAKNQAVSDRDYYKNKCLEKLEEEGKPSWYYWF